MTTSQPEPAGDLGLVLVRNDKDSCFEAHVGDERVGLMEFGLRDGVMTITHTETEPAWGGRGIAAQMTRLALETIREDGLRVVPTCPYTAHYISKHVGYHDLLA